LFPFPSQDIDSLILSLFSQIPVLIGTAAIYHTLIGFTLVSAANFTACKNTIESKLHSKNATVRLEIEPILWPTNAPITHFRYDNTRRPLLVTTDGCIKECGQSPDIHSVNDAFQVLTTWVLPMLALVAQLPFESLSKYKRQNLWALMAWIGSPATTLAATIWNIYVIRECAKKAAEDNNEPCRRDVYYVLSCLNQYEYPLPLPDWDIQGQNHQVLNNTTPGWHIRDQALFYGLCVPLQRGNTAAQHRAEAQWMIQELAYQLRMNRRRAVLPLSLSLIWFYVSFVISIVIAFEDLGDNTTAHSLALGLLLSWLPSLVLVTIIDRNPITATRCKVLIERWLYNCDKLLHDNDKRWTEGDHNFIVGDFIGQGRYPGYRGVGITVLHWMEDNRITPNGVDMGPDHRMDDNKHNKFMRQCISRPWAWVRRWLVGLFIQSVGVGMAFLVSFNTPIVGLGCRTFLYLLYYLFSLGPWLLEAFLRDQSRYRSVPLYVNRFCSTAAALLLPLIMFFQVFNALNSCYCKASVLGTKNYGGYVDFENAQYYKGAFNIMEYWAPAAVSGLLTSFGVLCWVVAKWSRCRTLWSQREDHYLQGGNNYVLTWIV